MTFNRQSGTGSGYNSGGDIYLTDGVMNGNSLWETGYVLHEIGHNWDDENPQWTSFLALSNWTQTDPNDPSYIQTTRYGETWWYRTSPDFASDYAKSHPFEDFAESFAAYFLEEVNLPWYSSDGQGASAIPSKIRLIDNWVNTV
jgi:hypothetical protein